METKQLTWDMYYFGSNGLPMWHELGDCKKCGKYSSNSFLFMPEEGILSYEVKCERCGHKHILEMTPEQNKLLFQALSEYRDYFDNVFPSFHKESERLTNNGYAVIEIRVCKNRPWAKSVSKWLVHYDIHNGGGCRPCDTPEDVSKNLASLKDEFKKDGLKVKVFDRRPKATLLGFL